MKDASQRQLPLNIALRDEATLDNFFATSAVEPLLNSVRRQLGEGGEPFLYCYGTHDTGKTHLLQSACHLAGENSLYLPLLELRSFPASEVLQGMEKLSLVCVDDVDSIAGDSSWEPELFHFFNRARENHCRLFFSGSAAPRELPIVLSDLLSRLTWGEIYQLGSADDDTKQEILRYRAKRLGLEMPAEVARYIVSRAPRALSSLLGLLRDLDAASLAHKRALTVPFVREQLGW